MQKNKKKDKNYIFYLKVLISFITVMTLCLGAAYGMGLPLPNIGAISAQIQSVETAADGAFSALQGLAETLGYAPGAYGGPLFNPGPGLSEAMATADKLTADVSKMQEEYQNIVINYDKLGHLVNSVENAVNNINNLNANINNAFNQIPQELTKSDIQVSSPQDLISNINSEGMEFQNLKSANNSNNSYNPADFISGATGAGGGILNKSGLENESQLFSNSAIYNSDGNTGNISPSINCASYNNGYYLDGNGNYTAGCTDFVNGFVNDVASSNLYSAGVSAARAHKAELEGDGFMQEITNGTLKTSTNYYAYQSSILTITAEIGAANLKNLGYIESQLKQLELSKTAGEIKKEHIGAVILPQNNNTPDTNFYNKTTL